MITLIPGRSQYDCDELIETAFRIDFVDYKTLQKRRKNYRTILEKHFTQFQTLINKDSSDDDDNNNPNDPPKISNSKKKKKRKKNKDKEKDKRSSSAHQNTSNNTNNSSSPNDRTRDLSSNTRGSTDPPGSSGKILINLDMPSYMINMFMYIYLGSNRAGLFADIRKHNPENTNSRVSNSTKTSSVESRAIPPPSAAAQPAHVSTEPEKTSKKDKPKKDKKKKKDRDKERERKSSGATGSGSFPSAYKPGQGFSRSGSDATRISSIEDMFG